MKLGIVIPCFNESANIPDLISECTQISRTNECQFLILDNGSEDDTWSILSSYQETNGIRFFRIEKNQGYGYGIQIGLQILESDYVGWMHGDLQTEIKVLPTIIPLLKPTHFFKGKRRHRKKAETLVSHVMAWLVSIILRVKMSDINAQPMIFHRTHLDLLISPPNDFNFDLYVYYSMIKAGIQEERINTIIFPRRHGKSAWDFGLSSRYTMSKGVLTYTKFLREKSANHPTQN
jgi:glycosyltransferase involved in cell wall biosynthesis